MKVGLVYKCAECNRVFSLMQELPEQNPDDTTQYNSPLDYINSLPSFKAVAFHVCYAGQPMYGAGHLVRMQGLDEEE